MKGDPGSNYQEAVSSAYSPVRRVSRRAGETRILIDSEQFEHSALMARGAARGGESARRAAAGARRRVAAGVGLSLLNRARLLGPPPISQFEQNGWFASVRPATNVP